MRTARAALVMIVAAVISTVVPALDGVSGAHGNVAAAASTAAPESTIVIDDGGGAGDAVRVGIGLALIVGAVGATVLLTRRKARRPLAR